jgi:hypothetical protein
VSAIVVTNNWNINNELGWVFAARQLRGRVLARRKEDLRELVRLWCY